MDNPSQEPSSSSDIRVRADAARDETVSLQERLARGRHLREAARARGAEPLSRRKRPLIWWVGTWLLVFAIQVLIKIAFHLATNRAVTLSDLIDCAALTSGMIAILSCGRNDTTFALRWRDRRRTEVDILHRKTGELLLGVDAPTLEAVDIHGADLRDACLNGALLARANLSRASLKGGDLQDADLRGANLAGADLSGADLRGARLEGADVRGANFAGAIFRRYFGSGFPYGAIVTGVRYDAATRWPRRFAPAPGREVGPPPEITPVAPPDGRGDEPAAPDVAPEPRR